MRSLLPRAARPSPGSVTFKKKSQPLFPPMGSKAKKQSGDARTQPLFALLVCAQVLGGGEKAASGLFAATLCQLRT